MNLKTEIFTSARCPYCDGAKRLLSKKGIAYEEIRIDLDEAKREELAKRTGRSSVPQIFIGETHIGGYDDLVELHRSGSLDKLLNSQ